MKPLALKSDYLNVLLDQATNRTQERGSLIYELKLGVSLRELRALRAVGGTPGITIGGLVERCGIEKTLTSKLVSTLVQRHLVRRQIGAHDARQTELYLTDQGRDLVLEAEPLGRRLEALYLQCLTSEEIEQIQVILNKLIEAEKASRPEFEAYISGLRHHVHPRKAASRPRNDP